MNEQLENKMGDIKGKNKLNGGKKKSKVGLIIVIIIALIILVFGSLTVINIMNAKNKKPPIMYYSKNIEPADGSITYNVFPYKVVIYKNHVTPDEIYEVMWVFSNKTNPFYDPNSPHSELIKAEKYVPAEVDLKAYISLLEDVVLKMENKFFENKFDEAVKQQYNNPNNINISTNINMTGTTAEVEGANINNIDRNLENQNTNVNTNANNTNTNTENQNVNTNTITNAYKKIYISTTLDGETFKKFEEMAKQSFHSKPEFANREIIFATYEDLREKKYIVDNKLVDGVFLKISTETSSDVEQTIALQIIDMDLKEYSQKVIATKVADKYEFEYKDDFDQQERIKKEVDILKEIDRKEKENKRVELEKKQKEEDDARYKNDDTKIKALLNKKIEIMIDGVKAQVEDKEYIKTLRNKTSKVQAFNNIILTNNNELLNYQTQKRNPGSGNLVDTTNTIEEKLVIKEKVLNKNEVQSLKAELDKTVGYSGLGKVGNDRTVEVKYFDKTKYILLSDISKIFQKYGMKI